MLDARGLAVRVLEHTCAHLQRRRVAALSSAGRIQPTSLPSAHLETRCVALHCLCWRRIQPVLFLSMTLTRAHLALALLALLASAVLISAAKPPASSADDEDEDATVTAAASLADESPLELVPFSAYDYLNGEWDVYRHVLSYSSGSASYSHSLPVVRWRLEKDNATSTHLVGRAFLNDSAAGADDADALAMRVEMHDVSSGKILTGSDEDHLNTLASFSFSQVKGSLPLAVGIWKGAEVAGDSAARFVMQAANADRFTITVTPSAGRTLAAVRDAVGTPKRAAAASDDDDELHVEVNAATGHPLLTADVLAAAGGEAFLYVAQRVRHEQPKTFFERYGTFLLLGGMLAMNIYMRTRQSGTQLQQQISRASKLAAPAANARRHAAASQGARIEEITEGSDIQLSKKDK